MEARPCLVNCLIWCGHGYNWNRLTIELNAFHAAGECRRQVKNVKNVVKNVNIVGFHDHIWNHHEKCIQISTNMPSIGFVIPEIVTAISRINEPILAMFVLI